jgi:cardiolipin synthase C
MTSRLTPIAPAPAAVRAGALRGQRLLALWVLASLLFLGGCATAPTPWQRPPAAFAVPAQPDGLFASVESTLATAHGAEVSGFRLLESSTDALKMRLVLVDNARHSIDLQYYVWFGDASGQLLLARTLAAADRGVKVRILFDDLSTMLRRMTSPELRDAMLARVDKHPNIQVRVFNPWHERGWLGRAFEMGADFTRLNRRMHNKQMVVDNRAAILGGRNIGDEYLGLNAEFNFHDLDVLGIGPVARQASAVFDRYWNSEWVRAIPSVVGDASALSAAMIELPPAAAAHPVMHRLLAGTRGWATELAQVPASLHAGRSAVHTDSPSRAEGVHNHMPDAFRELLRSARREVLITNAYVIPDARFMADLRELAARGVAVSILTNSLASNDVPAVNAHYEGWRAQILQTGTKLFELRADAAIQATVVDTAPVRSGFIGLHTKAMVIDRERSFIGSMNLDPRSGVFNSEMGVIIDSAPLAAELAQAMQRDMSGANSWQLRLTEDSRLRWHSDAGELSSQPARSVWQRVENLFFKLMPASYY